MLKYFSRNLASPHLSSPSLCLPNLFFPCFPSLPFHSVYLLCLFCLSLKCPAPLPPFVLQTPGINVYHCWRNPDDLREIVWRKRQHTWLLCLLRKPWWLCEAPRSASGLGPDRICRLSCWRFKFCQSFRAWKDTSLNRKCKHILNKEDYQNYRFV